jgi:hypothetical protein
LSKYYEYYDGGGRIFDCVEWPLRFKMPDDNLCHTRDVQICAKILHCGDPCNFQSVVRRRREQQERLLALAMGTHPRLGHMSPARHLPKHLLADRVAPFILHDGLFADIIWPRCYTVDWGP